MDVLIITEDKRQFDECVATYAKHHRKNNKFHHIKCRDDLAGWRAPVEVRFWGTWYNLPEAPQLEWIAEELQKARP